MSKLTAKQKIFCDEYLKDMNATQAAIRAGYSAKSAKVIASEILTKPYVRQYLAIKQDARAERTRVNADYVLMRLVEIDQMDAADIIAEDGTLLPIKQWPKVWRQFISGMDVAEIVSGGDKAMSGFMKKVRWPDKMKNLELLGKHIGVGAFTERTRHDHVFQNPDGSPVSITIKTSYVGADSG